MLLKARVHYREMAKKLGVSLGTIANDVKQIFQAWAAEQFENVREQAALDLATMNDAIRALTVAVRNGDTQAVTALLRILERRARMLGLDAPQRLEHTGKDGGPIETQTKIKLAECTPEELEILERLHERTGTATD